MSTNSQGKWEFDEDGNEVIVPDEVIEEYGDLPETVKNTEAETE